MALKWNRKWFLFVSANSASGQTSARQTLQLLTSVVTLHIGLTLLSLFSWSNSVGGGPLCMPGAEFGFVSAGTACFVVGVHKELWTGSRSFQNWDSFFGTQGTIFGSKHFDTADPKHACFLWAQNSVQLPSQARFEAHVATILHFATTQINTKNVAPRQLRHGYNCDLCHKKS